MIRIKLFRPDWVARSLRISLGLAVCGMSLAFTAAQPAAIDEPASQLLLRLIQYDEVLDDRLPPAVAVCVDATVRQQGVTIASPGKDDVPQPALNRIRDAAETCSIASTDEPTRLVGEIRASLQQQLLVRAAALEPVRHCLSQTAGLGVLHSCLTNAIGVAPTADEWQHWVAIYMKHDKP
ncbi:hypothetical protein [Paraburkholderia sp. RL17-337-BIB-A]|uniref:hypothetical protein n=1 Tax=Paraburkholderia sp. RL17-337-BIB-A TaxID=3031636 RepID=UPI0038B880D4